ncbi:hypothetical protein P9112_002757 [Eukaryota sp. TZLM1-RC]
MSSRSRLLKEASQLAKNPPEGIKASPNEGNLFNWHFTMLGPLESDFQGGIYHGRILLPSQYPLKPPDIIFDTPNGRFQPGVRICLNVTSYHESTWNPSWTISSMLLAVRSLFTEKGGGAIGSIDSPPQTRRRLAQESRSWQCHVCGIMSDVFPSEDLEPREIDSSPEEETIEEVAVVTRRTSKRYPLALIVVFVVFVMFFWTRKSSINHSVI